MYLDKGEFTQTSTALGVSDGDLPVVLDPAPATEDVVYAGGHLVPLVVVPEPEGPISCQLALTLASMCWSYHGPSYWGEVAGGKIIFFVQRPNG